MIDPWLDNFLAWGETCYRTDAIASDPIRGGDRAEIPAALLYTASLKRATDQFARSLTQWILERQTSSGFWLEFPYGESDEKVGFAGTVTTCFVIIALCSRYGVTKEAIVLASVTRAGDALYEWENDGHVKKAAQNRSSVLNTGLLAAIAFLEISKILPVGSKRAVLFREATHRITRRVLSFQRFDGGFPYHFETLRVSALYQAMVCAELAYIEQSVDHSMIRFASSRGQKHLESYIGQSGECIWDRCELQDKRGAPWFYSFALASPHASEALRSLMEQKLEECAPWNPKDPRPQDPFYYAWVTFGLIWSLRQADVPRHLSSRPPVLFLFAFSCSYLIQALGIIFRYIRRRVDGFIFPTGAVENQHWKAG